MLGRIFLERSVLYSGNTVSFMVEGLNCMPNPQAEGLALVGYLNCLFNAQCSIYHEILNDSMLSNCD
jgi:hypothetical protein